MITELFLGLSIGVLVSSFFICIFSFNLVKLEYSQLVKITHKKIFSSTVFIIFFLLSINIFFMIIGGLLSIIYMFFFQKFESDLFLSSNINFSYFIIILTSVLFFPSIYFLKYFRISIYLFAFIFIIIFGWILPFFIS